MTLPTSPSLRALTTLPDLRARVRELRTSQGGLLLMALAVGAGAGLGAVAFRWLIGAVTRVVSGHADFSGAVDRTHPHLPWLGPWFVVLAPVVTGLVYGPLVHRFAREARGHGVPEVMYAVARRGGVIRPQVAGVKALASALCIGGGGSVGREGPIVQIGAALGSSLGGVLRVPEARRRVLVACGAAGGIAATFNAPLAGVFFAMELILGDFAAQSFGMVVVSAVTASVIGRAALGDEPFLHLPAFHVDHVSQYALVALLGLLAGLVGVAFLRVLYAVEDGCDRVWRGPEWLRPAAGGVVLGLLLLVLPQMYGVGYPVLGAAVGGRYGIVLLLVLLVGKMLATSLTIGIGGSGGVFAPSLFVGAMLGAAFGEAAGSVAPGLAGGAGTWALLGMGAVFAGAARAPITAVLIMVELTNEYSIVLPLMAAIVLATGVSHLVSGDTIYTLKLRRRGIDLSEPPMARRLRETTAAAVVVPAGPSVHADTRLPELVGRFAHTTHGLLPVEDDEGRYVGQVTARAVAEALAGDEQPPSAGDLVESGWVASPTTSLADCLDELDRGGVAAVPVCADGRLLGWVTLDAVLAQWRSDSVVPSLA